MGTLRRTGLRSPTFRTVTCTAWNRSGPLPDVPTSLAEILNLHSWALAALGPPVGFLWHLLGQACMEKIVDISLWKAEDTLAFVLYQALCQQNSPK